MDELLPLAAVLAGALVGGRLASRLGYPPILGEILAGVVIGPAALGLVDTTATIEVLGELGVLVMMLSIGMHLDSRALGRASGAGVAAAVGGFVLPLGLGTGLMALAGFELMEAVFVGLAMGVTSLAVNGRILVDLRILDTRIAYVLMAGALLSDLAVLVAFAAILDGGPVSTGAVLSSVMAIAAYGSVAWVAGRWALPVVFQWLARLGTASTAAAAIGVALLFAWGAEVAGLHAVVGTFLAGMFLTERRLGTEVVRGIRTVVEVVGLGMLAPIFFVAVGFEVSLDVFRTDLVLVVAVIAVASLGKVAGTVVAYALARQPWREGLVVGAGMNGRGAVEIIVAEIALAQGVIGRDTFSILVFMAIVTTASVPVLLTRGVQWLRSRGELQRAGTRAGTVIVGAGPVARVTARLLRTAGPVRLVDTNRVNQSDGEREGLEVVAGSAFDDAVLAEAGIDEAERVLALTPNVEANLLVAQIASRRGVPSVAAFVPDADTARLSHVIGHVARMLPGPVDLLDWDRSVASGAVSERSIPLDVPSRVSGVELLPDLGSDVEDVLPMAVVSEHGRLPWTDDVGLVAGDRIVVLVRSRRTVGDDPHRLTPA